jgi:hypothetical protein
MTQASQRRFRIEADWYGGGFHQTLRFDSKEAAHEWSKKKFSSDSVINITERDPKTFREIDAEGDADASAIVAGFKDAADRDAFYQRNNCLGVR